MRFIRRNLKNNFLVLNGVKESLSKAGVVSADREAEILVRHFGQTDRIDFFTGEKELSASQRSQLTETVEKRAGGVPLSYLLKETEFFGHKFFVDEHVLVPRPETEILVQEALRLIPSFDGTMAMQPRVLDIGTGCGCIAIGLTLERPDIRMTALDVSEQALKVARKNRDLHGLGKKIELVRSDLYSAFHKDKGRFWDIIVSNPPYIPEEDLADLPREVKKEPVLALDGGPGGLRVIEKILGRAPRFLRPGGFLLLEIGIGQSEILAEHLARMTLYGDVRFVKDYNGIDRVLIARHG